MNKSAQFKSVIVSVLMQLALNAGGPELVTPNPGVQAPASRQPEPSPVRSIATTGSFNMADGSRATLTDDLEDGQDADDAESVAGSEATEMSVAEVVQAWNLDQDIMNALQDDELSGSLRSFLKANLSGDPDISLADTSFVDQFGQNKQVVAATLMSSAKRGGTVAFDANGNISDVLSPELILAQTDARTNKRDAASKGSYYFAIQDSKVWHVKDSDLLALIDEEVKVRAAVLAYQNGVGTNAFVNGNNLVQYDLINQAIGKKFVLASILTGNAYTYATEGGVQNGTHWFGLKFVDREANEYVAYCPLDSLNHALKLEPADANPNEYPVQRQLVAFGDIKLHIYDLNRREVASKILSEVALLANSTSAQVRDVASTLADIMPDRLSSEDKVRLIKQFALDGKMSYTLAQLIFGESLSALDQYQGALDSIMKATSIVKDAVQQRGQGR